MQEACAKNTQVIKERGAVLKDVTISLILEEFVANMVHYRSVVMKDARIKQSVEEYVSGTGPYIAGTGRTSEYFCSCDYLNLIGTCGSNCQVGILFPI